MKSLLATTALALIAIAQTTSAQSWSDYYGYTSIGTAYRPVVGMSRDVTVTSAVTISASAILATSDTSVFRMTCSQRVRWEPVKLGATANISPSGVRLEPGAPEYFPMDINSVPAFRADDTTASCNVARMKK